MIRLLVFDVDGTLYDMKHHEIPASCRQAIAQAKAAGIRFAIATGRTHYALGKALNDLKPDYILGVNGAVVVRGDGTVLAGLFRGSGTPGERFLPPSSGRAGLEVHRSCLPVPASGKD